MPKKQDNKKNGRGALTLDELLRPAKWSEASALLLHGVHILGYALILLFIADVVGHIFFKGTILWNRAIIVLVLGVVFVIGVNYYGTRKNKRKGRKRHK